MPRSSLVCSAHGGRWAAVREFSDEPESDDEDDASNRDSFDVDNERESQVGDVDAEREAHAIQVIHERMSQMFIESFNRQQPLRRRMTDPPSRYPELQREEIHVEQLTATRLSLPMSTGFERGGQLSHHATYTPSFTNTTQFFSSMSSIQGAGDDHRRATLAGVEHCKHDKLELTDWKNAEPEDEPVPEQRWTLAAPPSSAHSRYEPTRPVSDNVDKDALSESTKSSRRRRLSTAVRSWFK